MRWHQDTPPPPDSPLLADGEQGGGQGSTMGRKHPGGHRTCGLAVEVPLEPNSSSEGWGEGDRQAGTSVSLRSVWSRSRQGSHQARPNPGYNSDK